MMRRFEHRPSIGCSPSLCLRQDVSKASAVENAGVLLLQPMIEPGKRLDMQTLPRPSEAMRPHHCDLHMLAVPQPLVRREGVRQMKRHVLPVASQIDWHLDAIEQRKQIAVLPPGVAKRVLRGDSAPEIVPWMGIMVQVE